MSERNKNNLAIKNDKWLQETYRLKSGYKNDLFTKIHSLYFGDYEFDNWRSVFEVKALFLSELGVVEFLVYRVALLLCEGL